MTTEVATKVWNRSFWDRLYIERQEQHHRTQTFQEEYRNLLQKYHVEFDERYVWD
ncbi:MAG: hypothetical protein ABSH34_15475 [Verrucomicrobiota bacterium]